MQEGEDPGALKTQNFIFLCEAAVEVKATGWVQAWDSAKWRRVANMNGLSVSSSLTSSQQPQSPGPV